MTNSLYVWLRGQHLATIQLLRNGRMRLRYTSEALDTYGVGACPLSLSMPLTDKRVQGDQLERFLGNLLPEGAVRAQLERENRLNPGDTFGLLSIIGRECAGAIQLIPEDVRPTGGHLTPLSDAQVAQMVAQLPTLDPPEGEIVSASLGGIQAKLLLTRTEDGWAWPADGAMSTHIIKPEPVSDIAVVDLVRWEEWALRLANASGVRGAVAHLEDFDGRTAIVVSRFDRIDGEREHQEDFAQALAIAPAEKYEATTRGDRSRLASLVDLAVPHALDPEQFLLELVRQLAFNLIVGNGDAHAKNYSLAIDASATYSLTPLYDVAPVYLINERYQHFGHALDRQVRLPHLTSGHLVREASNWGLPDGDVVQVITEVAAAVSDALPGVPIDVPAPEFLFEDVNTRAKEMVAALAGFA